METDDRFRALKLLADHPEGCTEACHPPGYFAHDAWFRCRAMRQALLEAVQAIKDEPDGGKEAAAGL